MKTKAEGICEFCGHYVGLRQKAHIVAEGRKAGSNLLMLCPTCRIMFDVHIKPKVHEALVEAGVRDLPESWRKSIYAQAAEASARSGGRKHRNTEQTNSRD